MDDDPSDKNEPPKLHSAEGVELMAGMADLMKAGLPLPQGLRALAEEMPNRRLRAALLDMADRVERGASPEKVLAASAHNLPPHLHGILVAGLRSGQLPQVLDEYVRMQESQRRLRHRLQMSLAYPILLTAVITLILFFFDYSLFAPFGRLFKDFNTDLPQLTVMVFATSKGLHWGVLAFLCVLVSLPFLLSDAPGLAWLAPIAYRVPLLGSLLKYSRWSMLTKLASIFLAHGMPLPETFRLIAAGMSDPYLRRACSNAARDLEMGCGLSDAVQLQRCFPPSLGFFLRWGEKNAAVSDALDSVNMIYESRAKKLAASFAGFITPLVYIFVILLVGIVVLSVFLPLFSLISSLSYSMHRPPATEAFPPDFILMQMLGVLEAGVILLVVKLVLYWSRWPLKRQLFENVLNFLGWAMAFAATTFLLVFCVNVLVGVFWILAVPSFVILTQFRKMRANQQSFLWLLAMAAEKNMPLAPALTAFAQETGGRFGNRILELSAMLREGIDLPDALRMVPDLIPEEHMTIICSAEKSGVLAQGLRAAASSCDKEKEGWGLLSGKLAYLLGMVLVTCGLLTFIMIKIIPSFEKIFKDFGEKLPDVTLALIGAANHSLIFWPILTLAMIFVALAFLYSFFRYLGFRVIDLPGVERLLWRKHSANILDNLAISVENNRTINAGLGTLAQCYPTASIRVRLSAALVEIAEGDSWLGCLLRHKLIGKADYAVLQAAQRAGNLPWAMREMAETNRRRLAARMNALAQAAFPPVVLCFGAIFLLLGCALFKPLILLIIQKSC